MQRCCLQCEGVLVVVQTLVCPSTALNTMHPVPYQYVIRLQSSSWCAFTQSLSANRLSLPPPSSMPPWPLFLNLAPSLPPDL
jgi:hypothetical protein